MAFCSRAPRLPAAACLAHVHRLSPHIVTAGLPFQVPKWDVNQTHLLLLLLLLWLCNGQSTWPFGCKSSRSAGIQPPQREVSACGQKVKKWNGSGPSEGGWRSSCHEAHFSFRWMSAFELQEANPAKQNTPVLGGLYVHVSSSSPLSTSLIHSVQRRKGGCVIGC